MAGVHEIVELSQDDFAAHIYRLAGDGAWTFEAIGGSDGILRLDSIAIEVPLGEIYAFASLPQDDAKS